jgi:hypothetical protein
MYFFDGKNISFDASLFIYINSTNIPPSMITNKIYEHQNLLSQKLVSFLVLLRTYQHPYMNISKGQFLDKNFEQHIIQGGSNMTGTDLFLNHNCQTL